jgi:hypothetical protein
MRIQTSLAVAAAALVVFTTPSAAHAAPKPCDLLIPQSASAIFGTPVKPMMDSGEYCFYQSSSENANVGMSLSSAAGATPATLNALVSKGDTSEAIAGLGDQNLLITKGSDTYTLVVIYHGELVSITAVKRRNPAMKAAMIATMRQILGKL